MARIRGLERKEAPLLARALYAILKRRFGKELTPYKVQACRPAIMWMGTLLGRAIERSGRLEPRLHLLVQLRVARCVGCPF